MQSYNYMYNIQSYAKVLFRFFFHANKYTRHLQNRRGFATKVVLNSQVY